MIKLIQAILFVFCTLTILFAGDKVYVDDDGLLKWTASDKEAVFFGVNYSVPFAHAYRAAEKLGISPKEAIDMDVSQMARLEFNAYRIHVWDREVSDSLGNLLKNEHLDLLDYLIFKLKEKQINIILTPIAWWGPGWPEPDAPSPGFSNNYSKEDLIVKAEARTIQKNYIAQFINHKNKYTDLTYKDDPDVIAFEIINEPGHPADTAVTIGYINEMVSVIRNQDVTKPIYYNISQNWSDEQAAAVYNANIQGISFQWYPTGLVKYSELTGNYLAHVDHYPVPQIDDARFKNKTRMVYEFDAADIAQSVMYPAMARSFREAGMQWATMFSYDPSFMAGYNTEYSTHYLNLLYTPSKAISLMIAANVFRDVNVYQKFRSYPANLRFGAFRLSYDENLSEMISEDKFYHSNTTDSNPLNPDKLQHIAGVGSSPLVKTNSLGAYFIDKLDEGLWRLELYPDAVERMNPFGKNSLDNKVRVLLDTPSEFRFTLPGMNNTVQIHDPENNKNYKQEENGTVALNAGVYILSDTISGNPQMAVFDYNNRAMNAFPVPRIEDVSTQVINISSDFVLENRNWKPQFKVISNESVKEAIMFMRQPGWRGFRPVPLSKQAKYIYGTEIKESLQNGIIEYCLFLKTDKGVITYPAGIAKNPNDWDFYASENTWRLNILPANASLSLFNPAKDFNNLIYPNVWRSVEFRAHIEYNEHKQSFLQLDLTKFKRPLDDFTLQIELDDKLKNADQDLYRFVEFQIENTTDNLDQVLCRIVDKNLKTREVSFKPGKDSGLVKISLDDFVNGEFVLLPRPYPHFLPYKFKSSDSEKTEARSLNFIQFSIPTAGWDKGPIGIKISDIKLVK